MINKSLEHTTLTFGRQRIVLDDSALRRQRRLAAERADVRRAARADRQRRSVKADLSYVDQVNRVFGPDSPVGRWHGDVVLANVAQTLPIGTLTLLRLLPRSRRCGRAVEQHARRAARGLEAARQDRRRRTRCRTHIRRTPARTPRTSRTTTTCSKAASISRRSAWRSATRCSAATARRRSRRRSRRCTRSKAGPTSSSRRPPPASRTSYVKLSYPIGKRGAFTNIERGRVLPRLLGGAGLGALRRRARPAARRAHRKDGADAEVRGLPRGSAVHRHRQALAVGRLRVLSDERAAA